MLPATVKSDDSAVPSAASATVWSTEAPVQSSLVKRWKTTLPVGSGTAAGVPAVRVTNTLSWTTVPGAAVVITAWAGSWMSVRAVASAHSFVAGPELAPTPLVSRWRTIAGDGDVGVGADDGRARHRRGDRDRAAPGATDGGAVVEAEEDTRAGIDREGDDRPVRRGPEAEPVTGVHVDVAGEDVVRPDRVGRQRRRDLDVRIHERLHRVAASWARRRRSRR